jgi:hypothetical protein
MPLCIVVHESTLTPCQRFSGPGPTPAGRSDRRAPPVEPHRPQLVVVDGYAVVQVEEGERHEGDDDLHRPGPVAT